MARKTTWFTTMLIFGLSVAAPSFAADTASAVLEDADGKEVGKVTLTAVSTGVLLDVDLTAVPPGDHAFHIHAVGKCEAPDFKSAGGHFNPAGKKHGVTNPEGPHAGDMPNIHVPGSGALRIEVLNTNVSLGGDGGLFDDDGSAIVIHAGPDDYRSDPAGDAGARIACGVITE